MDFLSRWTEKLTEANFLVPFFPQCQICLLYADDTLLFLKPSRSQILRIKILFHIFGQLSGLRINLSKSELAVTSSTLALTQNLAALLDCKPHQFPIKYLGLPLSDKQIARLQYTSLIEKIQSLLTGWKSSLLSIGGRLILVNAVMSAMPLFLMSVFLLPKWVIKKIDQIRRRFLWHGHKDQSGQHKGIYMVNWSLVTTPRKLGGLGVRNLHNANRALLMKWQWLWLQDSRAWWKQATPMTTRFDRPWDDPQATIFWKSLKALAPAFRCSVKHQIGNGEKTRFWHDNWIGKPLKTEFPNLYHLATNKTASVAQCSQHVGWNIQHGPLTTMAQLEKNNMLLQLQAVQTSQAEDSATWLRSSTTFSVRSAYNFLSCTPAPLSYMQNIWILKAPLRVSVFAWLLLNNRLSTIDNLVKKGWCLPNMCIMCRASEETAMHLVQHCSMAKEIRAYIKATFNVHCPLSPRYTAQTSTQMLIDSKEDLTVRTWEITTCFVLWRERCRRLFSAKDTQPMQLVREIRTEHSNWFISNS